MSKLPDLGFSKGTIVETIVSSYSADGQPNAAPMGVIMENEQHIIIRFYNSSSTYRNILSKKCAVVNVTSDVETFYRTTFKEANPTGKIPLEWFEKAENVDAPRLRSAEATVEIALAEMKPIDEERTEAVCDVKLVKATKTVPKAYCRALFATVEAIIHATRVKAYLNGDEKQREQALKLLEIIKDYRVLVNRLAPNSRYAEIMSDLTKLVNSWRVES
ncbi:DUF447 family protein [Candidatus Bathyarchaeota archaeon A05DMB-2]|jgi:hypothetical protein|nr:DUF447 family protein [Candidatus Bathyarchaeota archaeon A05DMB-2]